MPRAAGDDRQSDRGDEPADGTPQPRSSADHTSALGGTLRWPFGGPSGAGRDRTDDAEVVGIEIFEQSTEPAVEPGATPNRRPHGVQPASGPSPTTEEPTRPGSSRPASRVPAAPRRGTRPTGPTPPVTRAPPQRPRPGADSADPTEPVQSQPSPPIPAPRWATPSATSEPPAVSAESPAGPTSADPAPAVPALAAPAPPQPSPRSGSPYGRGRGEHAALEGPVADALASVQPERSTQPTGGEVRPSFLTPDPAAEPARHGLRGLLNRFGLTLPPSEAEDEERRSVAALGRAHEHPRTIAVVNGKGGSNKTPTAAVLAAVLARYGGASVLAWDNNETRGTLGWRTESGDHTRSVQELLATAHDLLGPTASASDLARYVHHQPLDRYDVLRSGSPSGARLTRAQYDAVHGLARKYYRTVVVDSGNDESADRWQQMVDRADRLVVATTALGEHVESGVLMLEELAARGGRAAELARSAVVIVSQSDRDRHHGDARRVAADLARSGMDAVVVPYDRSLHSGRIRFDALGPASKRAWLAAAAVVAEV